MPTAWTPAQLSRIAYHVYDSVENVRDPYALDRKALPWWSFLKRQTATSPLAGPNGVTVKYKTESDLKLQGWRKRDPLQFSEQEYAFDAAFQWSNVHMGLEITHDEAEANGFVILPNNQRSAKFGKPDSKSEAFRVVDFMNESIEAMNDKFDVDLNQLMLTDNSADSTLPQGLDELLPVGTVTGWYQTGSIGGRLRSQYIGLQHYVAAGLTYSAGGTMAEGLRAARLNANLNQRGRPSGDRGVDFIMAGAGFIDRYVKFAINNGLQYQTQLSDTGRKLDLGLPDSGITFEGIPIIHNPTFELLDGILAPGVPWTRRFYALNSKSWKMAYAPGKSKYFSCPADESDLRVMRFSLDSKCVLLPLMPNANACGSAAN